jgi:hypothetical protein
VRPYGEQHLVAIADTAEQFVAAIDAALTSLPRDWRNRVDQFLSTKSWDRTWAEMSQVMTEVENRHVTPRQAVAAPPLTRPGDMSVRLPRSSM